MLLLWFSVSTTTNHYRGCYPGPPSSISPPKWVLHAWIPCQAVGSPSLYQSTAMPHNIQWQWSPACDTNSHNKSLKHFILNQLAKIRENFCDLSDVWGLWNYLCWPVVNYAKLLIKLPELRAGILKNLIQTNLFTSNISSLNFKHTFFLLCSIHRIVFLSSSINCSCLAVDSCLIFLLQCPYTLFWVYS